jgi:hypothetical protein
MTKSIETLAKDIYHVLDPTTDHEVCAPSLEGAVARIGAELDKATDKRSEPRAKGKLWASDLGKPCLRQHWYNFNEPEEGEKLNGHTKFKFLYGNLLEEAVLWLSGEAGHKVENPQASVELELDDGWTVRGRIDATIDGTLIDVKTTSSYGYKKYTTEGLNASNDTFGYRYQLGFYSGFGDFDYDKSRLPGFVWIDKQNGHIAYTEVTVPSPDDIRSRAKDIIKVVDDEEMEAPRAFTPEPYGKSGNMKLATGCSYCAFKHRCWRDANNGDGLRTFLYSHGPVFFTDITRQPAKQVKEIT